MDDVFVQEQCLRALHHRRFKRGVEPRQRIAVAAALGNVLHDADHAERRAAIVAFKLRPALEPAKLARIGPADAIFDVEVCPLRWSRRGLGDDRGVFGHDQIVDHRRRNTGQRLQAEEFEKFCGSRQRARAEVDGEQADLSRLLRALQAALGFLQRHVGLALRFGLQHRRGGFVGQAQDPGNRSVIPENGRVGEGPPRFFRGAPTRHGHGHVDHLARSAGQRGLEHRLD
ncbi:hypothetical protein D9M73_113870 [compost metagenome]